MKGSRPLTSSEINILRDMFRGRMGIRNRALFFLGANTGFRVSELLSLTLGDVLEDTGEIKTRLTITRRNMKGQKSGRSVVLNTHGKQALVPWLMVLRDKAIVHRDDPLFISERGSGPISRIQAWRILNNAYAVAGLTGKLGTHAMRKTFANNVYNHLLARVAAGEPIDAFRGTSKALGHTDIKSTDQYLSFRTEEIDETIIEVGV